VPEHKVQLGRSLLPLHISAETGLGHVFDYLISRVASFQTRVLATAAIVAVAALIAFYAAPYGVRETDEFIRQFTTEDSTFRSFVPPGIVLRTVQFVTLFAASLLLLLVWGYVEIARDLANLFIEVSPQVGQIGGTVVLLIVLVLSADLVKSRIRGLSEESDRVGEHEESVLIRVTNLTIAVTVGLALLSLWIEDIGSLLVGARFLGIVFGMGARQILAAALAGFVLMFSRPFEVGDWVEIGDAEGTVMDISLMHSHLRSFDGETVVIPNDEVEASTVVNRTDRGRLRLAVDVGVDYESDLDRARGGGVRRERPRRPLAGGARTGVRRLLGRPPTAVLDRQPIRTPEVADPCRRDQRGEIGVRRGRDRDPVLPAGGRRRDDERRGPRSGGRLSSLARSQPSRATRRADTSVPSRNA
jgi:small-conductance mechanosensitive channel